MKTYSPSSLKRLQMLYSVLGFQQILVVCYFCCFNDLTFLIEAVNSLALHLFNLKELNTYTDHTP